MDNMHVLLAGELQKLYFLCPFYPFLNRLAECPNVVKFLRKIL